MSVPSRESTHKTKIPKDWLLLLSDGFCTSDHSSCLICLKTQAYIPFKTSEIILAMGKKHISAGYGWIFGSTGMSGFHTCAMCQELIIISCIHCCLASIFSPQCTTNNTPNDESTCRMLWFGHGQPKKLLIKRSIMGFTSYTVCAMQETKTSHRAKDKNRTTGTCIRIVHMSFIFKATLFSNIPYWLF